MKRKLARELVAGDYARYLIAGEPLVQITRNDPEVHGYGDTGLVPRRVIHCHNPAGRSYTLGLQGDWFIEVEERPG